MLVHSLASPPNQRRLERELVLAFDSGANPVVVLTKADVIDDQPATPCAAWRTSPPASVLVASGITGEGVEVAAAYAEGTAPSPCSGRAAWARAR